MIDHRRLVRDIYDPKLLQSLSKSRPSSRNEFKKKAESGKTSKRKHSSQSNSRAAESVLSLWNDEFDDSLVMDSRRRGGTSSYAEMTRRADMPSRNDDPRKCASKKGSRMFIRSLPTMTGVFVIWDRHNHPQASGKERHTSVLIKIRGEVPK